MNELDEANRLREEQEAFNNLPRDAGPPIHELVGKDKEIADPLSLIFPEP